MTEAAAKERKKMNKEEETMNELVKGTSRDEDSQMTVMLALRSGRALLSGRFLLEAKETLRANFTG
jgi:hypothetical protein